MWVFLESDSVKWKKKKKVLMEKQTENFKRTDANVRGIERERERERERDIYRK